MCHVESGLRWLCSCQEREKERAHAYTAYVFLDMWLYLHAYTHVYTHIRNTASKTAILYWSHIVSSRAHKKKHAYTRIHAHMPISYLIASKVIFDAKRCELLSFLLLPLHQTLNSHILLRCSPLLVRLLRIQAATITCEYKQPPSRVRACEPLIHTAVAQYTQARLEHAKNRKNEMKSRRSTQAAHRHSRKGATKKHSHLWPSSSSRISWTPRWRPSTWSRGSVCMFWHVWAKSH